MHIKVLTMLQDNSCSVRQYRKLILNIFQLKNNSEYVNSF